MAIKIINSQSIGGGLGNHNVFLAEISGTYPAGGFSLFPSQPVFAITNKGYTIAYDPSTKKTQIFSTASSGGGSVTIPKGDLALTNTSAVTGVVSGEACAISAGRIKLSGPVEGKTYAVSGAKGSAGGELPADTKVDGISIFAIF